MQASRELIYQAVMKYRGDYNKVSAALRDGRGEGRGTVAPDCLIIGDPGYPKSLMELTDPPWALFWAGDLELLNKPMIAMVGSRITTEYSRRVTAAVAKRLAARYVIVSGMALGTDRIAQINAPSSIGVVANGLDIAYPAANRDLYRQVRQRGLLLSEYPPGVRPAKQFFPFRNRIIAALGRKTVITAARPAGGTMTTAELALRLGREIYSVPYPIGELVGQGNNELIEEGASMIISLLDVDEI